MDRGEGELFAVRCPIHCVIEERCLILKRPWFRNFGHWLVDQAAALSYLVHTGNLCTRHIVVGKVQSAKMREIMMQTVAAILPDAVVHEHPDEEVWQFRHLDYVMPVHTPPLFKLPAALDYLRSDLRAVPVPEVKRCRRIFITRTGQFRRLVNEPEIMALCAAHGFEAMQPESLSIAEQAALFANAEAIMGIKGAAMTNVLFATTPCTLMVLSPGDFIDPFFWDITSTRDIAYGEVFGELQSERAAGLNDFRVELPHVEAMIQSTLPFG
jgi:capsular polysaccharide biosynthesis protein